ncbi:proto-oncogene Mas-like [Pantherophis guttatus]|uniref:Proto-oncogene Mas-like n=1 Tax=Pantherophis guttatus TaxID=94885 RepID=A0A6P9CUN4_PANGU|nr:proto-oncogene Mas-like [Pantherophis guttatus]XP_034283181.1 proto-oncogene Mas-like [Pantherophis guttatus]
MMEAIILSPHTITMKTNHTEPHISSKRFFMEMVGALSIPICFWGLIGNAAVFWLLCRKVKKTTFIVYFLNLIIADFIVAAYFLTVFCVFLTSLFISYYFLRTMESIYSLSSNASIFLLTVICFERYVMVSFPLYYQQHRPKDFTTNMCCIIWFWSFLVALMLYVGCYPQLFSVSAPRSSICHGALLFESIVQLMVFFPIMSFSAFSLFIRRRKRAKQRTKSRLDITLIIIVVLSLICIFTFQTLGFISNWVYELREPTLFKLSLLFDSIKSSINPLVYFFVGNQQRQKVTEPMYKLLERALNDKESTDTPDTLATAGHKGICTSEMKKT